MGQDVWSLAVVDHGGRIRPRPEWWDLKVYKSKSSSRSAPKEDGGVEIWEKVSPAQLFCCKRYEGKAEKESRSSTVALSKRRRNALSYYNRAPWDCYSGTSRNPNHRSISHTQYLRYSS